VTVAVPDRDAWGTGRASRLFPDQGVLVHADLHNHTRFSDGSGDPRRLFGSLREQGLDAAAITDHVTFLSLLGPLVPARRRARRTGVAPDAWVRSGELADRADEPGTFVALRGFEWSHPAQGHVNVWGPPAYVDPLRHGGIGTRRLYRWLARQPAGVSASFNHPGVGGPARFSGFRHRRAAAGRVVAVEVFNKFDDYLCRAAGRARRSPLAHCLDAGWRVAIIGVTDEHGVEWGVPEGKGRTGLYVRELTRAGVLEALAARRAFASRVKGLRLDASAGGVRMGGVVTHRRGPLRVEVDLDAGPAWHGRVVSLQVLRPGGRLPRVAAALGARVPRPDQPPIALDVDLDVRDGDWLVLRVSDPEQPAERYVPPPFAGLGRAVAYASPWWLEG